MIPFLTHSAKVVKRYSCPLSPGRLAVATITFFSVIPMASALTVVTNGDVLDITAATPLDGYSVSGAGSTLNAAAANLSFVDLASGGTFNMNGGSVLAGSDGVAIEMASSTATITNATISSDEIGLSAGRAVGGNGSQASVTGSTIVGLQAGARVTGLSTLQLNDTQVTGSGLGGVGLQILGGDVTASNGSTITGAQQGVVFAQDVPDNGGAYRLVLDGSSVIGTAGPAIQVTQGVTATVDVLNGSTLSGGNGNLLEVEDNSTANVQVSGSALTGNIVLADGSTGTVSLSNGAALTGSLTGVNSVTLDASSLTGDYTISDGRSASLTLQNGASLEGNVINVDSVTLDASSLNGDYTISDSRTASLTLQSGASLAGNLVNVDSVTLDASSMTGDYTITDSRSASLILQNAASLKGNLINVDNVTLDASSMNGDYTISDSRTASLTLQDGASLTGSLANVDSATLDASSLTGDYTISDGRNARLALQNAARFTGNLNNVGGITLAGDSIWNMVASNSVGAMSINDSSVKFGSANEFFQLDVGTLAGNGTFLMDVDFATNQHDLLNVTGVATGTHSLVIPGSGVDPASPEQLTVVRTGGGDATFALAGASVVDVGTYSYALNSVANGTGTDWFLDPSTKTISPGTRSVLALFNTAPTVWYGELTSLRTRMGELRLNGGQAGGWARTYGNKYDVNESSGLGYQQTQKGFSLGADAPLPIGDGQWLIGVLAGHSTSDLDVSRGTSGTVKSYYVGAYTTWLDKDTGYYFDGVLKFNRFRNDAKVSMSDGARAKGDYDNVGLGGSVEFGRHIKLDDGYFVEPFTQWSTVVIQGKDYGLDNGMQAQGDRTRSLLGKVGVTAGRNFAMQGGSVVQPYVRVAGVHEFAKNNEVQVNNNTFNNDLSGSRGELGAGVAVAFNDRLQLHADFDYSNGDKIEQPFGANVGLRYSW